MVQGNGDLGTALAHLIQRNSDVGMMVAYCVILSALVLAYGIRYLAHKETMRLYERNGEVGPILEARERRRNRWARLHGLRLMVVGIVFLLWFLWCPPSPSYFGELRELLPVLCLMLIAIGLLTTVTYSRWDREEEDRLHPPTAEQLGRRELRRLRVGLWIGAAVVLIALVMLVLAVVYVALAAGGPRYANDLPKVVNFNPLERVAYVLVSCFLLLLGAGVVVLCGWLSRERRRSIPPAQGREP
jgi:hypothetical protein